MLLKCSKCNNSYDETNFYLRGKTRPGQRYSYCKQCFNSYNDTKKRNKKIKAIAHLGGSCCMCGYNKSPIPMQFHHIDRSKKEFDWATLKTRKWETIKNELSGCILVCANCHFLIHSKE